MLEEVHAYPLRAPVAVTNATAILTNGVKMSRIGSGQLEIELMFGAVSATDSTGDLSVTVVESSAGVSTDGTAVAFSYRLSAAVGSDTLGAIVAVDSTSSAAILATDASNAVMFLYVDPNVVAKEYIHAVVTPSADSTSYIVGAIARFVPRYAQGTPLAASTT
jgi:hypothetical protein